MTAITMIMVVVFAQSSGNPDVVDKARSELGSGSFSLSDYEELVSSEKTVPQNRLQEWLVIRGLYAWALALRKPTKEQESKAVAEAKECLTRAKGMGRIDIRQICPGDCWEFAPAAAKVYWNALPDVGSTTSQPDETLNEFRNQKQPDTQKVETDERRLQDVENRRKQADTELRALSELLSQKRNLLSELDALLSAKQQEIEAKQTEIERLSAVLLDLKNRIAAATATKPSAATKSAPPPL